MCINVCVFHVGQTAELHELRALSAVKSIDARSSEEISEKVAEKLADAIWAMPQLETFGTIPLLELRRRRRIDALKLSDSSLGIAEGLVLANALRENKSLKTLDISRNHIKHQPTAKKLSDSVIRHTGLRSFGPIPMADLRADRFKLLNLAESGMCLPEALVLAALLKDNQSFTITNLDVSSNEIEIHGAVAIAEAVLGSEIVLNLSNVGIAIRGAEASDDAEELKRMADVHLELAKILYYSNVECNVGDLDVQLSHAMSPFGISWVPAMQVGTNILAAIYGYVCCIYRGCG